MVKKGDLFVVTTGDYSNYTINAHFKAKQDFSIRKAREDYVESLPMVPKLKYGELVDDSSRLFGKRYKRYPNPIETGEMHKEYSTTDGFLAYLIRQDLVDEVDCVEHNLDYLDKDA